jgi:predicted PurR-regulated permease PerM
MSFFERLEELRKKPEETRRRILAISLTVLMFAVVILWLSTIRIGLKTEEKKSSVSAPSPLKVLKESFQGGTASLKNAFESVFPEGVYEKSE